MSRVIRPQNVREVISLCNNIIPSEAGLEIFCEMLIEATGCTNIRIDGNTIVIAGTVYKSKESILKEANKILKEYEIPKDCFGGIYDVLMSKDVLSRDEILKILLSKYKIKAVKTTYGLCLDCNLFYDLEEMRLYFSQKTAMYTDLISDCSYSEYIENGDGVILDGVAIVFASLADYSAYKVKYPYYALFGVYDPVSKKVIWKEENSSYFVPVNAQEGVHMHFLKYLIEQDVFTVVQHKPLAGFTFIEKPYPVAKDPKGVYLYAFENPCSKLVKVKRVITKASTVVGNVKDVVKDQHTKS